MIMNVLKIGGFQDEGNTIRLTNNDPGFLYFVKDIVEMAIETIKVQ